MTRSGEISSSTQSLDAAWEAYHSGIEALRGRLHALPIASTSFDRAAADRWLLQSQAAAHNLVLTPDPQHPRFLLHNVFEPNVYSWLLPNPDFLYRYAFVDGSGTYRIEGVRRNAHFVDIQTLSGFWDDTDITAYPRPVRSRARRAAASIHVSVARPRITNAS